MAQGQAGRDHSLQFSASELRELAAVTPDGAVVQRLLAIALILDGYPRAEAAQLNGMDRQTLRGWVHRYNDEGVAGLRSRLIPGRPAALNGEQMEELRSMVLEGTGPGTRHSNPLALHRPARCDRRSLVGGTARALGRQAAAPAWYDQTATAALPSEEECCGSGGFSPRW